MVSKDERAGKDTAYWSFQRSCAFLTLARAVSSVNGGVRDMVTAKEAGYGG
jgi:hypothetical protein